MANYISKYTGSQIDSLLDTINGADSNIQMQINEVQEQVDTVQEQIESKQTKHASPSILLSVSDWNNNTQAVSVNEVTANSTVIVSPAPESIASYTESKIYCSAQGDKTLTFACETIPATVIQVNVVILN